MGRTARAALGAGRGAHIVRRAVGRDERGRRIAAGAGGVAVEPALRVGEAAVAAGSRLSEIQFSGGGARHLVEKRLARASAAVGPGVAFAAIAAGRRRRDADIVADVRFAEGRNRSRAAIARDAA